MNLFNLRNQLSHIARSILHFGPPKHTYLPDSEHLDHQRRCLLSPYTQATDVLALLRKDPHFLKLLPTNYDDQHLIVVALCGLEVRANLYVIQPPATNLRPIYHEDWAKSGLCIFRLYPDGVISQVTHPRPGKYYDPFNPLISYGRYLTAEEEALFDAMTFH